MTGRNAGRKGARPAPRIHPLVPAVVAVIVCGVLVLVVARIIDDDPSPVAGPVTTTTTTTTTVPTTTTTTTTIPDPVPVAPFLAPGLAVDPPTTYRIDFEIVENGLARQETWTVRRPYESLIVSSRDGTQISGAATSRTDLYTYLSDRNGWISVQGELHRAAYDQRPAAAVGAMAALGLVEELGEDTVAGRPCTRYLTGQPTSASGPTPPSDDESTELCIDGAGLVLHELWKISGSTVVERTATSVETGVEIDPAIFDPGPEAEGAEDFAAAFTTIAVPADQETLDRLRTSVDPPDGYALDSSVFRATDPSATAGGSSEIVRFYSDGADLLELAEVFSDRDTYLGGEDAVRVAVDGWDEVWLLPGFRNSVVRARLTDSSYVELRHHDIPFMFEVLGRLVRSDQ